MASRSERPRTPTRDRRDIGEVLSPIDIMMAAREASSCCVGVEALLEVDARRLRESAAKKTRRRD